MIIWIVFQNGVISDETIEVFDSLEAAKHHAKMLNKKWNITQIIKKEIKSL